MTNVTVQIEEMICSTLKDYLTVVSGDACDPVVMFGEVGCTVTGIPHIFDSVVFIDLSLGLHMTAFCCGVNDGNDEDVLLIPWP